MATQASTTLDVRADFPILSREIDGKRIVYLDSAASAQKPEAVLDAMDRFYRTSYANVHRGVYTLAQEATDAFEGALSVVDGAQGVPQLAVDIPRLGVDFYAWTGHKALGPTGVGVLHGRAEILTEMRPWLGGGHMIARVERDHSTWTELPWKFEAGTDAIAEAIGLGAAVDYL